MIAKIYYYLIKKGCKTIDDVKPELRAEVQALLDSDELQEKNINNIT